MTLSRDLGQEIEKTLWLARGLEDALVKLGQSLGSATVDNPDWNVVQSMAQILSDRLEDMQTQLDDDQVAMAQALSRRERVVDIRGGGLPNRERP